MNIPKIENITNHLKLDKPEILYLQDSDFLELNEDKVTMTNKVISDLSERINKNMNKDYLNYDNQINKNIGVNMTFSTCDKDDDDEKRRVDEKEKLGKMKKVDVSFEKNSQIRSDFIKIESKTVKNDHKKKIRQVPLSFDIVQDLVDEGVVIGKENNIFSEMEKEKENEYMEKVKDITTRTITSINTIKNKENTIRIDVDNNEDNDNNISITSHLNFIKKIKNDQIVKKENYNMDNNLLTNNKISTSLIKSIEVNNHNPLTEKLVGKKGVFHAIEIFKSRGLIKNTLSNKINDEDIVHRNEKGRVLNEKEAHKEMSQYFHGKNIRPKKKEKMLIRQQVFDEIKGKSRGFETGKEENEKKEFGFSSFLMRKFNK